MPMRMKRVYKTSLGCVRKCSFIREGLRKARFALAMEKKLSS